MIDNNNIIVDLLPPLPFNPITSYRLVKSFKMIRLFPSSQQKPAELSICPQTMIFLHLSGSSSYCCHLIYFSSNHNLREPAWQEEIHRILCCSVGGVRPRDLSSDNVLFSLDFLNWFSHHIYRDTSVLFLSWKVVLRYFLIINNLLAERSRWHFLPEQSQCVLPAKISHGDIVSEVDWVTGLNNTSPCLVPSDGVNSVGHDTTPSHTISHLTSTPTTVL